MRTMVLSFALLALACSSTAQGSPVQGVPQVSQRHGSPEVLSALDAYLHLADEHFLDSMQWHRLVEQARAGGVGHDQALHDAGQAVRDEVARLMMQSAAAGSGASAGGTAPGPVGALTGGSTATGVDRGATGALATLPVYHPPFLSIRNQLAGARMSVRLVEQDWLFQLVSFQPEGEVDGQPVVPVPIAAARLILETGAGVSSIPLVAIGPGRFAVAVPKSAFGYGMKVKLAGWTTGANPGQLSQAFWVEEVVS